MIKWIKPKYLWQSEDGRFEIYYPSEMQGPWLMDNKVVEDYGCFDEDECKALAEQILKREAAQTGRVDG